MRARRCPSAQAATGAERQEAPCADTPYTSCLAAQQQGRRTSAPTSARRHSRRAFARTSARRHSRRAFARTSARRHSTSPQHHVREGTGVTSTRGVTALLRRVFTGDGDTRACRLRCGMECTQGRCCRPGPPGSPPFSGTVGGCAHAVVRSVDRFWAGKLEPSNRTDGRTDPDGHLSE